jgi:hypothetical protein
MNMSVFNRLSCCRSIVYADVHSIEGEILLKSLSHFANHGPQSSQILWTELEDARYVTTRDDEGMAFGNRKGIQKCESDF